MMLMKTMTALLITAGCVYGSGAFAGQYYEYEDAKGKQIILSKWLTSYQYEDSTGKGKTLTKAQFNRKLKKRSAEFKAEIKQKERRLNKITAKLEKLELKAFHAAQMQDQQIKESKQTKSLKKKEAGQIKNKKSAKRKTR